MRTWIESGLGAHCLRCFIVVAGGLAPDETRLGGVDCLPPSFGLDAAESTREPAAADRDAEDGSGY